ncbi:hypothetical protein ACTGW9_04315 [Streptococcus suis]
MRNKKKEYKRKKKREKVSITNSTELGNKFESKILCVNNEPEEIKSKISEEIEKLKLLKFQSTKSLDNNQSLSDLEKQVIQNEIYNIVDSIISATEFLINGNQTILQIAISVRYILEALITTELLIKEEEYKFILYLAIYPAQIERLNSIVNELKEEVNRLKEWDKKEKTESAKVNLDETNLIEKLKERWAIGDELMIEFSELELNMYSDIEQLMENGFSFNSYLIESKIIPEYREQIQKLEKEKELIGKRFKDDEIIQRLFPDIGSQSSKVFKVIRDKKGSNDKTRSWDKKSMDAGLESEYKFVYSYTSNLSHFASYSIKTSNLISVDEEKMLFKRLRIYLKRIVNNLKIFSKLDEDVTSMDFSKFEIIEIS